MKRDLPGFKAGVAAMAALLLSGCATSYVLDNSVQAFSGLSALPTQPAYRFERLPSQQSPVQDRLEAMADPALHQAGLRRDDAAPRYSVQVSGRMQQVLSPWGSSWETGWGYAGRRRGFGYGFGGRLSATDSLWYHREVGLVVRELGSGKVVFESQAASDGPWSSNDSVFPAMFQAALEGFPNPPAGPRQVNVQVAR